MSEGSGDSQAGRSPDSGKQDSGNQESYQPGRLVADRYQLVREIGRGGMGLVWLAEDVLLGRQVAVKELRPPQGLTDADRRVRQSRALREARSAARIEHPGAVRLYEVIPAAAHDDAVYLIMELVEGPTLEEVIARHGPLPAARVAGYGLQLLDALEAAHALGIVHRDVKPGNIIIARGDRAMLADFGIAHIAGDSRLTTGGIMGTQAYLAPELFDRSPVTPAADLWSLGATLYAAAEGTGPFDKETTSSTLRAILLDDLPVPRCAPDLADAITRLLRRDPQERASVAETRARLLPAARQEPPGQQVTGPQPAGPAAAAQAAPGPRLAWDPSAATGLQPRPALPDPPAAPARKRRFPAFPRLPALPGRTGLRDRRTAIITVVVLALIVAAVGGFLGARLTASGAASAGTARATVTPRAAASGVAASGAARPSPSASSSGGLDNGDLALNATISVPSGTGHEIAFSPGGKMLALYGDPSTADATLWNVADGTEIASLPFGTDPSGVAFSPDGTMVAVAEHFGGVGLWNIASKSVITNFTDPDYATGVAFSPDGRTLAVAGMTGVRLWDVASRTWTGPLPTPGGSFARRLVMFSPNGATLAVARADNGDVDLWDVSRRSLVGEIPSASRDFTGLGSWISFRADSSALVIGSPGTDGTFQGVRLWNIAAGSVVATMVNMGTGGVNALSFSPADDDALAVGGDQSGVVVVWNIKTYNPITIGPDPDGAEIADLAFSPDGGTLATLSIKDHIYLWKVGGQAR